MHIMKKSFLVFALFAIQLTVYTQATAVNNTMPAEANVMIGDLNMHKYRSYNLNYDEIKGSPFIEKEKLKGHVILIDKSRSKELTLQYDIYMNEFFYTNLKGEELIIDQKRIREIYLTGEKENYHFKRINPKSPLTFYDILYDSESLSLFCEFDLNFYESKDQGITKTDARFSRMDKYYALQKGKKPKRIKLKKKDIYKYFSRTHQITMEKIIGDKNLSLKNRQDVKRLFLAFSTSETYN